MLLKLLIGKEGEVVSREDILQMVWGYDVLPSTRTIDNFIWRSARPTSATPSPPSTSIPSAVWGTNSPTDPDFWGVQEKVIGQGNP